MRSDPISIDSAGHRAGVLAARDQLVIDHLPMCRSIARGVCARLPPSFECEDLVQTGTEALIRAASRYRPARHGNASFATFARQRVRGAILDSVRRRNWAENTRPPLERPGVNEAGEETLMPIRELDAAATLPAAPDLIDQRRQYARVSQALSWLSGSQRRVLEEYYSPWSPTLEQVAERMRLTRPQVRRLHDGALAALRARLRAAA